MSASIPRRPPTTEDPRRTSEGVWVPARELDGRAQPDHDDHDDPDRPRIGDVIDGVYRITGELGRGGMGTVYLVRDEQLERDVAMKLTDADRLSEPGVGPRFLAEARAMARVHHPNVVTIHAFGSYRGQPYLVMEYVPGTSLAGWRQQRGGRISPADAVVVLEALCRGVRSIHEAGTIHRDLKPGNVLIGYAQRVAVTDFGLARTPSEGEPGLGSMLSGTPAYLAPELARGDALVPALAPGIDVYALGVMAFELLTGRLPFEGPGVPLLLQQHAYEPPPRPSEVCPELPRVFDAPIMQALAKAPAARTPTVEALRHGLIDAMERSASTPRGLRMLVVDDDANTLLAVRDLLLMSFPGADVVTVADPASALDIAVRDRPDLVISDLHMPHGGGFALTSGLRREPTTKDIPIVVVTAYGGASDWHQLRTLGADRFLVKPLDVDTLVSVVRSLLGRRIAS